MFFFQSYEYLNICYKKWLELNIIDENKLEGKNIIFDFKHLKDTNEEKIQKGKKLKNLLLFTVYRGKNSEGINFHDDEARMVICIGMPYPNLSDIKVKLKKDFLDEKYKKDKKGYNGWQWYREEAMVAVNQSLGRLIRNKDDYGIMICFGIEFEKNINLFSKWIKKNISCENLSENDEQYYKKLENFLINLNKVNINSSIKKGNDFENNKNDYANEENEENEENEDKDFIGKQKYFINKKRKGEIIDLDDSSIF